MSKCWVAVVVLAVTGALAAEEFTAREQPLTMHDGFVPVRLATVANASAPLSPPASLVSVRKIPFELLADDGPNCLDMRPIGWADVHDEAAAYPGYIANYDKRATAAKDPARAIVQVPVADYSAIWVLGQCDADPALGNTVTFRFGIIDGQARTTYHDFAVDLPRAGEKLPGGVASVTTPAGDLFAVRVPIGVAFAQDFAQHWALDLDITKALRVAVNQPDPYRYQLRPIGLPCGVRIFALTLERPSMQMTITASELGHVFVQPQRPVFEADLFNHTEHWRLYHFETEFRRDDGVVGSATFPEFRNAAPTYRVPAMRERFELPVTERGYYDLTIRLMRGTEEMLRRETSFAILAPDTRKYRQASPFGVWDFAGGHGTPLDEDLRGTLAVKAGLHYLFTSEKYGLETVFDPAIHHPDAVPKLLANLEQNPEAKPPPRALVFHETAISGPHLTRTPDLFTGKPPYRFSEKEQAQFDKMWATAEACYEQMAPLTDTEIYFGNGVPHVLEAFVRRGWPKERLPIAGNESGSFMRPPETQPLDFVANNAGLWMFRRILDHYGYPETKLYQCFEMCYPNSNPGNLSEPTQAAYLVRHLMHSLAWRVPLIRPMTLTDMANSYYHSNWGASGIMHAWPHVRPKPSYVAFAVLTQMLDGATLLAPLETGSPVVYAVQFTRRDGGNVTCLWTLRGRRQLSLRVAAGATVERTDLTGRVTALSLTDEAVAVEVSSAPLYLTTSVPIRSVVAGAIQHDPAPTAESAVLSRLDDLNEWTMETTPSSELEVYNFMCPRRLGNFSFTTAAEVDGRNAVLQVRPQPVPGPEALPMYAVLRHNAGIPIAGEPTEIGLWVHGNGGWGRIIFELADAAGQRWISIGAEQAGAPNPWMADWLTPEAFGELKGSNVSDWNSNDAWGRSVINHEGWRFLRFPLPGQYPGDGYHWPRNSQWRCTAADGSPGDSVVHYPLTFRKLVVTIPAKILYLTDYRPVPNQDIALQDLTVVYSPLAEAYLE